MATDQSLTLVDRPAAADLSAKQFFLVDIDSSGNAALVSGAGQRVAGVLQVAGAGIGVAAVYAIAGVSKCILGGTVAAGDSVKADSSGRAVTANAADIAAGSAFGICTIGGAITNIGSVQLTLGSSGTVSAAGEEDIVLGTTAPSASAATTYVETTGTVTGVLPNGVFVGQKRDIIQSVAASTPIGTISGTFASQANAAKTTLALGTTVGFIGSFAWNGTAWRQVSTLGGTGSSLS